jgi:hypothetical protein
MWTATAAWQNAIRRPSSTRHASELRGGNPSLHGLDEVALAFGTIAVSLGLQVK